MIYAILSHVPSSWRAWARTMRDYLSGRLARDLLRNEYVLEDTSCVVTDGAAYATENI